MPALYNARLDGVKALLPHREFADDTKPNTTEATLEVEAGARRVFARVGSLAGLSTDVIEELGVSLRDVATGAAAHAAELYAAGMIEGAGLPELARPNDTSSYATWLLEQYEQAVAELIELIDRNTTGEGVPTEAVATSLPAYSFPPVTFPDGMRF